MELEANHQERWSHISTPPYAVIVWCVIKLKDNLQDEWRPEDRPLGLYESRNNMQQLRWSGRILSPFI
jgi:hypothetical protein